ncbi:class I adenylate-forming enzyme family protein [Microcella sp.]|uniref:class I adenylate-forming enzyme family protein n=1 Tax=Microcella sp. TaxID=1913979 RepID=UPI00256C5693|nr:long-chain fatty acid--CoA ligase [Microcella sp.]MBX9471531.1 long-chain fatty acid--CoA ligase [Microcella sp.]
MSTALIDEVLAWSDCRPEAPAIVSRRMNMTFGELGSAVRRTASRLRQLGVKPGDVVGLHAVPEWEAVLTLAVLHEGAASLHASAPVSAAYGDRIALHLGRAPGSIGATGRTIDVDQQFIASLGAVNPLIDPRPIAEGGVVRVVFSSGTTGTPKGIAFAEATLRARTDSARSNWMPDDPFFCLLGIDTVSGFQTFAWSVLHGEPWIVPGDGRANAELLSLTAARSIKTSPARLAELLDALESTGATLPALQSVQVAGSLLSAILIHRCEAVTGVRPVYLYGSTEAGTITFGAADPEDPARLGTVVDGAELRVLDDDGVPVDEPGVTGIIEYRTAAMAETYWSRVVEPSPFRDGWFRPGDRGTLDEHGFLELAGRTDDLVNAGGSKVNLADLDRRLAEVDIVRDAATFAYELPGGLTAIGVVYASDSAVTADLFAQRIRETLPGVEIRSLFRVDTIPRNPRGKVSRQQLAALLGES